VNIPAVLLTKSLGTSTVAGYARRLGVTGPIVTDYSMALGTSEVTLQDMMTAYCTLANDGVRVTPLVILKVMDRNGQMLENNMPEYHEAVSTETAELATDMLRSVLDGGTAYSARLAGLKIPAAGKTGTTSDYTDAWFIGYTPDLVAGVWVGFDRARALGEGMTGSRAALPAWTDFMLHATEGTTSRDFPRPTLIVTRTVCPVSGLLATVNCPQPVAETFTAGEEPRTLCDVHPGDVLDQSLPHDLLHPGDDEMHDDEFLDDETPPADTSGAHLMRR
jgi:membrane carboxypeptidase/penicillin-binding protein